MELESILENQYVSTSLVVFLVLYGGLAAPKLPKNIIKLFSNPLFRLLVIFFIAYTSSKNHSIALVAIIVLILLMQDVDDNNLITNRTVVNSKAIVSKFKIDEEEEKSEGEIIHILKDKNTITESQIISSVINDEITKLQTDNKILDKKIIDEPKKIIESEEPTEEIVKVPEAIDKTINIHGIDIVDNPLSKNLKNGFETVSVRSSRGLENKPKNKKCNDCDSNIEYEIDTKDIILGYDGNGLYNFSNL